ncbi:guanidine nucleotide exchange factor [Reticulomyxa filosa]|uniref:Guanidine nucleotide exchange factor n=1 Tax=Reticulomyxa filosa TaxID=46433 RepID=X6LRV6_RETFI|nr:guanidine nucleotide exchange factor [Reticulomyxa filosa]|eukprot:ETO03465.1 guanidine nucleotide exchange factor [Reticulomyxa filosa]
MLLNQFAVIILHIVDHIDLYLQKQHTKYKLKYNKITITLSINKATIFQKYQKNYFKLKIVKNNTLMKKILNYKLKTNTNKQKQRVINISNNEYITYVMELIISPKNLYEKNIKVKVNSKKIKKKNNKMKILQLRCT